MDDARRLELIDIFVGTLIPQLGFTGDAAMREEHDLREALTEHRPVDYLALQRRAPLRLDKRRLREELLAQGTFAEAEVDQFSDEITDPVAAPPPFEPVPLADPPRQGNGHRHIPRRALIAAIAGAAAVGAAVVGLVRRR
jgi:hypothetical protein